MTSPVFSSDPKNIWHGCFSIVKYVSDVTVGGGGGLGVLPQKIFCLNGVSNRVILDKINMEI